MCLLHSTVGLKPILLSLCIFFSVLRMYNKSLTHQYVSDNTISLQVKYKTLSQYSCFSPFCPMCSCSLFYNLHVLNPIIHYNFYFLHTVNCPSKRFTIRLKKKHCLLFWHSLFLCTNFYLPIYFLSQELSLTIFIMQVYW